MSDFPQIDHNIIFLLYRCGRKKWILSQFIFLILADVTVAAIVFCGLFFPLITKGYWYNGWSNVITESVAVLPEESGNFIKNLIPPNLYFQMPSFEAAVKSTVLLLFYFYLLGIIIMAGKIFGNRIIGLTGSAFIIILGASTAYFNVSAMWFLPAAHSIVSKHYTTFFRQMNCSMMTSYGYFFVMIFALGCAVYLRGNRLSFNKFTEIE